ncbi:hypothetical protein U9M48_002615 [Paspalum notatum var. saurae]|uniref:Uncharacterized protein n=1 Tax=Paspalum notatum var. saurae TaxID=547442 RepID=A0AAQ3PJS2_PASNO
MAGRVMKILAICLLLSICNRGNAQHCKLSDLVVTQTGVLLGVNGNAKYTVVVENRCICSQADVKLSCAGFSSSMGVSPDVLSADGDGKLCTLNGGRPIGMGANYAIRFSYTWRSKIDLKPVSSTIACS